MDSTLPAEAPDHQTRRCLGDVQFRRRYATNRNRLIEDFYQPAISKASLYDRAVGYFRSSVFMLVGQPLAEFAKRAGVIRLICSPELTEGDIDAMRRGYAMREAVSRALERSLDEALSSPAARSALVVLATLIQMGSLEIRIAFRPATPGIFHDKLGIFRDGCGNAISFTGSANETAMGWTIGGNHESFDVFASWTPDAERVAEHRAYFERLWEGNEPGVEVIPFPEAPAIRLKALNHSSGIEAAYDEMAIAAKTRRRTLQPHQLSAVETWERRGYRGILEHATGSGKTLTALHAARRWLVERGPVLIVVPSDLLLQQWIAEARIELEGVEVKELFVGAGSEIWRRPGVLEGFTSDQGQARIVIATLQTAWKDDFVARVRHGQHLLMIVDEVHRSGSPLFSGLFRIDAGGRLGLSATPRRYGDPSGTQRILDYFAGVVPPPFTLADAIRARRLCRYNYHVHPVGLDQDERDLWQRLTDEVRRVAATSRDTDGQLVVTDRLKLLLIRRADVLKNARQKVPAAMDIFRRYRAVDQRWLVYCDDRAQLTAVSSILRKDRLNVFEYYSAMDGDRDAALRYFAQNSGVLVAIRCLDEGVDIPEVDHALILASSRNPREFIQRRGRVLRKTPGKVFAEIHDILVLGTDADRMDDQALAQGELARALAFAQDASNDAVRFDLRAFAREAGLDPDSIIPAGVEGDDAED